MCPSVFTTSVRAKRAERGKRFRQSRLAQQASSAASAPLVGIADRVLEALRLDAASRQRGFVSASTPAGRFFAAAPPGALARAAFRPCLHHIPLEEQQAAAAAFAASFPPDLARLVLEAWTPASAPLS